MIRFLFMLLFLAGCCVPYPAQASDEAIAARILQSSVAIEVCPIPGICFPIGSGTLVRDDELGLAIVTAEHVATAVSMQYRACHITNKDSCVNLGNFIVDWDAGLATDWAVYPIVEKPKGMRVARIAGHSLKRGESVWQVGMPGGSPFVSKATVAWVFQDRLGKVIQLHGFVWPGSSGGGVFDSKGRLAGITVAAPVNTDLLGFPVIMEDQPIVVDIHTPRIL